LIIAAASAIPLCRRGEANDRMVLAEDAVAQWIQVAKVGEIAPGHMRDYELLDGTMLGVANAGGRYHAFDATCPHRGGPLVGGRLAAGELICPWHGYRYALASGANLAPGGARPVRLFPVRVRGGYVEVEIP
jgi:nitrite reductase/ring-hydroxylating ferredoxin subunit